MNALLLYAIRASCGVYLERKIMIRTSEHAFIIEKDSTLYQNYYSEKREKEVFQKNSTAFFEKNFGGNLRTCACSPRLTIALTSAELAQYSDQVCKKTRGYQEWKFKASSPMQKEWEKMVWDKTDKKAIQATKHWFLPFRTERSSPWWNCNLVDDGKGTLYALIENGGEISVPSWAEKIQPDAYWKIVKEKAKTKTSS